MLNGTYDIERVSNASESYVNKISKARNIIPSKVYSCLKYNVMTVNQFILLTGYSQNQVRCLCRGWRKKGVVVQPLTTCRPFDKEGQIFIIIDKKCMELINKTL